MRRPLGMQGGTVREGGGKGARVTSEVGGLCNHILDIRIWDRSQWAVTQGCTLGLNSRNLELLEWSRNRHGSEPVRRMKGDLLEERAAAANLRHMVENAGNNAGHVQHRQRTHTRED